MEENWSALMVGVEDSRRLLGSEGSRYKELVVEVEVEEEVTKLTWFEIGGRTGR